MKVIQLILLASAIVHFTACTSPPHTTAANDPRRYSEILFVYDYLNTCKEDEMSCDCKAEYISTRLNQEQIGTVDAVRQAKKNIPNKKVSEVANYLNEELGLTQLKLQEVRLQMNGLYDAADLHCEQKNQELINGGYF